MDAAARAGRSLAARVEFRIEMALVRLRQRVL
jgi:hypothetical protein